MTVNTRSKPASDGQFPSLFTALLWLFLCCLTAWPTLALSQQDVTSSALNTATSHAVTKRHTFALSEKAQAWLAQHPRIKVGVMTGWPPFSFINKEGHPSGISVDYIELLNRRLGGRLQLVPGSWSELYDDVKQKRLDAILDITPKPERSGDFNFTTPYLNVPHVIIAPKSTPYLEDESALKGKVLALEKGFGNVAYFQKNYPDIPLKIYPDTARAIGAVARGDADAYAGNRSAALYIIGQELITNLKAHGRLKKQGSILSIGVRKDWPLLTQILNQALADISPTDAQKIQRHWVGQNIASQAINLSPEEHQWLAQHPNIRLASDIDWMPFESIHEGQYTGIAADYMRLIEQRLGINFIQSPEKPWHEITELVKSKQLDLYTCAMATEQREQYAIFTEPYIYNPMMIITRDNIAYVDGLEQLSGKTVAVENGYASHDLLLNNHPNIKVRPYQDTLASLLAVSRGEVDAYVGNIAVVSQLIQEQGISNIKISGQTPYNFELAMGVRDDWPELVSILQKTLDSISPEEHQQILQKWIAVKVEDSYNYQLLMQVLVVALILVLAVVYWNYLLKKKIKEHTSELMHQTYFDTLTDLPNRYLIQDRLSQLINEARQNQTLAAVISLDLDDFKRINDSLDFEVGNQLLLEAAERLKPFLRGTDTLGRPGADQFMILLGDLESINDVSAVAEDILKSFEEIFHINNHELLLTASFGIAIFPNDGDSADKLLRHADSAMHYSKSHGKNMISFYDHSMNRGVARRLEIERQMHGALERGELTPYFQPKIDVKTRAIEGFEVLLRWKNPVLGQVSPEEFIPIAEHNGLIVPIGFFVMEKTLYIAKRWQERFDDSFDFAVNLSPRQFAYEGLVETFDRLIKASGVKSQSVELEITEGVLMSGSSQTQKALSELKALGLHLAMDDFGTGYSSLSYLRNYPFDTLKIDREFINEITINPSDLQLVNATIALSHRLGLEVVAEGVETDEQFALLEQSDCDLIQGYLISKPLPYDEMEKFIADYQQQTSALSADA